MSHQTRSNQAKKIVVKIDPEELKEGVCRLYNSPTGIGKIAVCKEDGKIKIFEVEE